MLKLVIDETKDFDVAKVKAAMDNVKGYKGLLGTFNFTPKQHCGLDDSAIVIATVASVADPKANGLFRQQAPGQ
jgi:ABC-type branched-subunit amino acid transport system substrate-binding protein